MLIVFEFRDGPLAGQEMRSDSADPNEATNVQAWYLATAKGQRSHRFQALGHTYLVWQSARFDSGSFSHDNGEETRITCDFVP